MLNVGVNVKYGSLKVLATFRIIAAADLQL